MTWGPTIQNFLRPVDLGPSQWFTPRSTSAWSSARIGGSITNATLPTHIKFRWRERMHFYHCRRGQSELKFGVKGAGKSIPTSRPKCWRNEIEVPDDFSPHPLFRDCISINESK